MRDIFDELCALTEDGELYNVAKRPTTSALALKSCDMCASDVCSSTHGVLYGDNVTLCSARCYHRLSRAWAPTKRRVLAYRAMRRQIRRMPRTDRALAALGAMAWATAACILIFA